eukprot:766224-Hanusia_phi.AAC.1
MFGGQGFRAYGGRRNEDMMLDDDDDPFAEFDGRRRPEAEDRMLAPNMQEVGRCGVAVRAWGVKSARRGMWAGWSISFPEISGELVSGQGKSYFRAGLGANRDGGVPVNHAAGVLGDHSRSLPHADDLCAGDDYVAGYDIDESQAGGGAAEEIEKLHVRRGRKRDAGLAALGEVRKGRERGKGRWEERGKGNQIWRQA